MFQDFGGAFVVGYPATRRYLGDDGFLYQATQAALLQWRPELGTAVLANTFEMLEQADADGELLLRGIPLPMSDGAETFEAAKATRFGWLTDEAIKAKYIAVGGLEQAMQIYGLPMSMPEKHGPFIAQRFQRITFQHWVDEVPGAPSKGSVTAVLGGDLLKEFGLLPIRAMQPHSLEESQAAAEQPVGAAPEVTPTPTAAPQATATPEADVTPSPTPTLEPGVTPSATPAVSPTVTAEPDESGSPTPGAASPDSQLKVQINRNRFNIDGLIDEVGDKHILIGGYQIQIDHKLVRRLQIKGSVDVGMFAKTKGVVLEDGTLAAEQVKAEAPKAEKNSGKGDKDDDDDDDD